MKDIKNFIENNISDELLAAYIDGNTAEYENAVIEKRIQDDSMLSELYEIANDSVSFGSNFDWELHKGDFGFWELGLPPAVTEDDLDDNHSFGKTDDIGEMFNNIIENSMSEQFNKGRENWGEKPENIYDPVYIRQPDDHSCALRSQQIVLRDFGIDIPFADLEKLALDYGVYSDQGTLTYDIGKVLQIAGVGMHQVEGSTMYDLTNELAQGHRVIVSVDAYELWEDNTVFEKLKNWFLDVFGAQGGNHALIVAGVEVNPNNPNDVKVILTDPGAGHLRVEYPLEQFMDAWKDSNCFMAATDNPAPYQYDAATGMEIPSNFVIEQQMNQFIIENRYQLRPDLINMPENYQPMVAGHLDVLGEELSYDSFQKAYKEMLDNRMPSSGSIKEQIENEAKNHPSTREEGIIENMEEKKEFEDSDDEEEKKDDNLVEKEEDEVEKKKSDDDEEEQNEDEKKNVVFDDEDEDANPEENIIDEGDGTEEFEEG